MPTGEAGAAKGKGSAPDGGVAGPARCPRGGRHRLRSPRCMAEIVSDAGPRASRAEVRRRRRCGVRDTHDALRASRNAARGASRWGFRPGVADDLIGHGLERESNPRMTDEKSVALPLSYPVVGVPESNRRPAAEPLLSLTELTPSCRNTVWRSSAYATAAPRAPDGRETRAAGDRSIDASHCRPSPTGNPVAHAFPAAARIEHRDAALARLVAEFRAATTRADLAVRAFALDAAEYR